MPALAALLLVIIGVFYLLTLSPHAQLEINGEPRLLGDKQSVQTKIDTIISDSFLNRSKVAFNEEKINVELATAFPEFNDINVKTSLFRHNPVVTITFGEPKVLLTNGATLYVVSAEGTILLDASKDRDLFNTEKLPLVQDQSSLQFNIGKQALSAVQVRYIVEVVNQSSLKNRPIETLILSAGGGELDVRYGGKTYVVKYNLFEDPRRSVGTYIAMSEQLEAQNQKPQEYIDIRIPERAYIK